VRPPGGRPPPGSSQCAGYGAGRGDRLASRRLLVAGVGLPQPSRGADWVTGVRSSAVLTATPRCTLCLSDPCHCRSESSSWAGRGASGSASQRSRERSLPASSQCVPQHHGRVVSRGDRWWRVWVCAEHLEGLPGLREFGRCCITSAVNQALAEGAGYSARHTHSIRREPREVRWPHFQLGLLRVVGPLLVRL
jgi:hypothetical protein